MQFDVFVKSECEHSGESKMFDLAVEGVGISN